MGFSCGIVGLPNVGKSTIFNALSRVKAEVASYPFTTINPNLGVVEVPDGRLSRIADLVSPERVVSATIEFVDIAGLVKGASKGHGLGNQFLSHIRNVDAIIHVVRCFIDENVTHVHGRIDPIDDIEAVNTELILSDLDIIERRLERLSGQVKSGIKEAKEEVTLLYRVKEALEKGIPLRFLRLSEREKELIAGLNLITIKPVLYVANIDEGDIVNSKGLEELKRLVERERSILIPLCGKLESEISELKQEERQKFIEELGLKESGLKRLIKEGYSILNLITFYTVVGKREVRAWTIPEGTRALKAAGKVHSDFEKGFIRADVIHYDDFILAGSEVRAREMGLLRSEGRDYVVRDGDILHFYFHI